MAVLTLTATFKKEDGSAAGSGHTVQLHNTVHSNRNQGTTDSAGFASVSISSNNNPSGVYHLHFRYGQTHAVATMGEEWDASTDQTHNFGNITVPNSDPTKGTIGDKTLTEDTGSFDFTFSMSDPDSGDTLTAVKVFGPSWVTISNVSNSQGKMAVNTDASSPAMFTVQVKVTDNWSGESSIEDLTLTIEEGNNPPALTNPGTQNYFNNSGPQTLQLIATDADMDPLTFGKLLGPTWGTVNSGTGLISFDTNAATIGAHSFRWEVSDGQDDDTALHTVNIDNNPPVLTNPGNQNYLDGTGVQTLQLVATDADGDGLTFSKVSGDANITISSSGLMSTDTGPLTPATYPVTARVTDGILNDDESFNVVIGIAAPSPFFQTVT